MCSAGSEGLTAMAPSRSVLASAASPARRERADQQQRALGAGAPPHELAQGGHRPIRLLEREVGHPQAAGAHRRRRANREAGPRPP